MPTAAEFVKSNGLAAFGEVFIDPVVSADVAAKTRLAFPGRVGFHGFIDF